MDFELKKLNPCILPVFKVSVNNNMMRGWLMAEKTNMTALNLRIWTGKLVHAAVLIAFVLAAYWCIYNWDWIYYKTQRHYDRTAYGMDWKIELVEAGTKAKLEGKELLAVFLGDDEPSRKMVSILFRDPAFRQVENNYVLMLVDYSKGRTEEMKPREKTYCENLIKKYDVEKYGVMIVIDPDQNANHAERRRVTYNGENAAVTLNRIAGGEFKVKPPVDSTPKLVMYPPPFSFLQR